jgi:hypothetical protein
VSYHPDEESGLDVYVSHIATSVVQAVAELPYTMDEDSDPNLMLVTPDELRNIVCSAVEEHQLTPHDYIELYELREAGTGPEGFVTWKEAAISERVRRVKEVTKMDEQIGAQARCLTGVMYRLTTLLDEDQFSNIESMVLATGVAYPTKEKP